MQGLQLAISGATRPLAAVAAKTSRLFARSYDKWPDFITQSCD